MSDLADILQLHDMDDVADEVSYYLRHQVSLIFCQLDRRRNTARGEILNASKTGRSYYALVTRYLTPL